MRMRILKEKTKFVTHAIVFFESCKGNQENSFLFRFPAFRKYIFNRTDAETNLVTRIWFRPLQLKN
jgi:hypothetical protein